MNLSLGRDSTYRYTPASKDQRMKKSRNWGDRAGGGRFETRGYKKEDAFDVDVEVDSIGVRLYTPLKQTLRLLKY